MKSKIIIAIAVLLPILAVAQKRQFALNGKIQSDTLSTGKIYLSYNDNGMEMRDSAVLKNNGYHFEGQIADGAVTVSLFWKNPLPGVKPNKVPLKGFAQFYIEPGQVNVLHGQRFSQYEVTGSQVQQDNQLLNQQVSSKQLSLKKQTETEVKIAYIQTHPNSWLSYVLLEKLVKAKQVSLETGDQLYANLSPALKKHRQVLAIKTLLVAGRTAVVGNPAMDFTETDVNGKPITLSSYRGKYVLVDFWASWCHPCRAENPVVAKAFNNYKDKGFDVLGISLDGGPIARKLWLDAIKQDGVTWTQVSNLKGFDDEVVGKYGITSIPRNFLIDPNGKIVAMDLRGPELEKKLNEILNNKTK